MEKLKLALPVVVEGRYDKNRLSSVIDAVIVTTDGFAVFNSAERLALIRRLAEPNGILVLTDSDGGGRVIRSYLTSALPPDKVKNVYIPRVPGKERRKARPSKEGFLGVEGLDTGTLRAVLAPFAGDAATADVGGITKADLYEWGLTGCEGASERRAALCARLDLPPMDATPLLAAVNLLYSKDELRRLVADCAGSARTNDTDGKKASEEPK